jgi:hypothetical protein
VERKFQDDLELFGDLYLGRNGYISGKDMLRINQIQMRVLDDMFDLKLGQLDTRRKHAYQ